MRNAFGDKYIFNKEVKSTDEFDKSLLYAGKALYEVISFKDQELVFLEDHIKRINRSAKLAGLELWISNSELIKLITSLPVINLVDDGSVTLVFNYGDTNTFTAYINENVDSCSPEDYENGVDTRFHFSERENPNVKLFNRVFRKRAGEMLDKYDLWEVILVDKNGYITEASKSNVFMIKDDTIYTSPVEDVLPGVTRKHVIALCNKLGIKLIEKKIPYILAWEMDSVFITGTTIKILPVKAINDMGFLVQNPILIQLIEEFKKERDQNRFDGDRDNLN